MKSNRIFQYPLRSSRVVWRSKAPNIAALLTNTLLPREGNYSPSHLCYNVYSSRIIDGEIESCVKSCVGVDIGVDPGPVLVQRYGAEENGLELLCLERFEGSEDFYWRRLLQIPSLLQGPIRDLKLQTSHDFCLSRTQGINIFVRSTGEVAVLNLTGCLEDGLSYTILLRSGVGELLGGFQDGDGAGQGYVDHEVSIYCMVSSLYDFFEFSLLLSDRRILRMQFKDGAFRREMELDLNGIYEFEGEVVQTMAYGGGPGSYLLGGKGLYMLQRGVVRMLFPCGEDGRGGLEESTFRNLVSYKDRLMRLQTLRKKNISYSNITGIAVHPVYSNVVAMVDSRSSKVVVIDLLQNSRIPLGEFSIPFTESLGNHTARFRYIEWINPEMVEVERGRDRCRCGIMLFCSSYPRVVFSLIELEYREAESNQYYRMEIVGVRELEMGTWDLCQDRDFYSPRKTQLLESNADMLDIILEGYSVDDNALSQVFHGLSGLTALSLQRPRLDASGQGDGSGCLVTPPSTSRHCIFLRDSAGSSRDPKDSMEAGLMFLSLNTCGRLTCKYVYVYQGEEGDVETVRRLLYERVFGGELSGVYLSRGMKESLGELYQFILRDEEGLSGGLRRVSRFPQILRPGAGGMSGTDLACSQGSRGAGVGEGMNEELEVANEQLTRRQYYNSRVFSGLDLVSLLLGADGSEDLDFDGETETPVLDHASFVSVRSGDSENAQSVHGGRRCGSGGRFQVHSEDGEWSMEEIMSESRRMSLPLTLTNGFDYQKEFRGLPRALWTEDSVLSRRLSGECVHIPSLDAQPFPLCSCRYLEEASGEGLESSGDEDCYAGSSVMLQEGANRRSTPVFDVVGAKNYEFNSTLEEYLSFVQEDFPERSSGEGGGVYVLNDTLRQLSESINELPLTPVSERMAENYLKYNRYLGGRLNDERLFKKKWRVSQSCSRMKQPGCLLKYLAINELEVRRADEREEALRRLDADEGSESETRALSEDELERMFQEEMENDDREDDDEEEENDDREDDDEEDGEENDDREDDDEEDGEEEEKRGRSGRRRGDVLPRRGVLISKRLISTLKVFWDESCDFYGLNSVGGLGEEGEERRETLDLLEDDLSQWHDYPYVSFGSVDARIEEKENLRLSLMSYVDTQLSSL